MQRGEKGGGGRNKIKSQRGGGRGERPRTHTYYHNEDGGLEYLFGVFYADV